MFWKATLLMVALSTIALGVIFSFTPGTEILVRPPTATIAEQKTTKEPPVFVMETPEEPAVSEIEKEPELTEERGSPPAPTPEILVLPRAPIQGEPVMVIVENAALADIARIGFGEELLISFEYNGLVTALIGFDLKRTPGTYPLSVIFNNGTLLGRNITFGEREKIEEPLGIPEKLGGNTVESQNNLVSTLAKENAELMNIKTATSVLFMESFTWPLTDVVVTDKYGYSRQTGAYSIAHKGTDFRASVGTAIYAANRGVVRLAKEFRNYGNTVIVDHGLGIQTFYMHLSELGVAVGDEVERGERIGTSGMTGYAEFPHLHLTVRIHNVSVDPEIFYGLFE